MIENHKKWNKLLDAIHASRLFTTPITNKVMIDVLAPTTTLAFAITTFFSLNDRKSLKICVAGAGMFDANNDGDHYRVLPLLIGVDNIQIDLVGFDVNKDKIMHSHKLKPTLGDGVTVRLHEEGLWQYLEKNSSPDIVMLNHPGFELHDKDWFVNDKGIERCIKDGVAVLGCSYGEDEAEYDEYFARSFGFRVSEPINNPFHIDSSSHVPAHIAMTMMGGEAALKGSMDWGRQVWSIVGLTARGVDEELHQILELGTEIKGSFLYQVGDPAIFMDGLHGKTDDKKHDFVILNFTPFLAYIVGEDFIVDEDGSILLEDVDLDISYLKGNINSFQATIIIGILYRDHGDEIQELIDGGDTDAEDIPDMGELMSMITGNKKHTMSEGEMEINDLITQRDWSALGSFEIKRLKSWRNIENQSLFHISATLGELPLYEIAKKADVDILHRDNDNFAFLDVCAEKNETQILLKAIEEYDVDLNAADVMGITATHRAYTYGSADVIDALKKLGANPNPTSHMGVEAKSLGGFSHSLARMNQSKG